MKTYATGIQRYYSNLATRVVNYDLIILSVVFVIPGCLWAYFQLDNAWQALLKSPLGLAACIIAISIYTTSKYFLNIKLLKTYHQQEWEVNCGSPPLPKTVTVIYRNGDLIEAVPSRKVDWSLTVNNPICVYAESDIPESLIFKQRIWSSLTPRFLRSH